MKKYRVPIFTEEYSINICIGENKELIAEMIRYGGCNKEYAIEILEGVRGSCLNSFPYANPLIVIKSSLKQSVKIATLAHEASHVMDYIEDYLKLEDKSGEFHAHGIGAVMRNIK